MDDDASRVQGAGVAAGAWAPLRLPAYRAFWLAFTSAYIGLWMQNVGAGWLMTTLTRSPLLIASVQFATSMPAFLLSLPAGFLADQNDRKKILMIAFGWSLGVDVLLSLLTGTGHIEAWSLLLCTVMLGAGTAVGSPAVQSVVADIVPRRQLSQAVILGGAAYNIARSVGPALAGLIVVWQGPFAVFAVCSLCFSAMLFASGRLQLPPRTNGGLPPERLLSGMHAGLRYAWHEPAVFAVIVRTVLFGLCGAAVWALLPVMAQRMPGHGASSYGALVACLGIGALIAAFGAERLRARFGYDLLSFAAALLFALVTAIVAWPAIGALIYPAMVLGGLGWTYTLNTIFASLQSVLPNWVRARGIALYSLLMQGAMAIGSLVWGAIAEGIGVSWSLLVAGVAVALGAVYGRLRYPLQLGHDAHVTMVESWIPTANFGALEPDAGPIAVEIEYRIDPARRAEFVAAGVAVGRVRKRDGARFWRLYRDLEQPGCYRERFIVDSWGEYLRSRSRGTMVDSQAEEWFRSFHVGPAVPTVRHSIAER